MELLKIRENKPTGDNHGNFYYRDLILFYFDSDKGIKNQVMVNNEGRLCKNFTELKNNFLQIKELREKQVKGNIKAKTVIWCNKLTAAIFFWKQFDEWEEKWYNRKQAREKSLWSLSNLAFEIRNFDLICNCDNMEKLKNSYDFECQTEIGIMRAFLKMREEQGLKGWAKINHSFSNCELKVFYNSIDINNVPAGHWAMIPNLSVYNDLQKGLKHGVLANHDCLEKIWWRNIIESWDISSAYPSKLVNMKMPMGKFIRLEEEEMKPTTLIDLMAAGKYFYIRANFNKRLGVSDCPIFNGNDCEESNGRFYYTLTNFDLEAMKEWGFNATAFDFKVNIVRVAEFKDYIWRPVRELIYNRWVEKQQSKGINNNKYFRAKTAIDAIWGKSIQEFNPDSNTKIMQRFKKIQHFILPQWGLWTCAAIRLEMIKMIKKVGIDNFIAGDTDGIKTLDDCSSIFIERNKEIRKLNEEAGFPSDIGTWHFEGRFDNYIFLKSKFYAYSIKGKLECKFAGCSTWEEFFEGMGIDEVFSFLEENDVPVTNYGILIVPQGIIKAKMIRNEEGEWNIIGGEKNDNVN